MVVKSFENLRQKLKNKKILRKYKLSRLGVFGSFARGQKARDIDFYIDAESLIGKESKMSEETPNSGSIRTAA
jgi:predicted nucleotidyltransferase